MCLYDLAEGFNFQYGQDDFLLHIINTAIAYYPTCIPLFELKSNCCIQLVERELKKAVRNMAFIDQQYLAYQSAQAKVSQLGYEDEPPELYKAFVKSMEEEKKKRNITKPNTN